MNATLFRWTIIPTILALTAAPGEAGVVIAHTPTFTGNAWVAFGIIGVLIGTIFLLIMGALHVERRDARLGGRAKRDDGWFGIFPAGKPDEEDAPDFHHHRGGGDGGDGGEGGVN